MSTFMPRSNYVVPISVGSAPNFGQLGQKGAGLLAMRQLKLAVPPGFVLTTELWRSLRSAREGLDEAEWNSLWPELWAEIAPICAEISMAQGGDGPRTLAVRSAPTVSMPGIMETVLDVAAQEEPLYAAIWKVLSSAEAPRARDYRRLCGLTEPLDVAVVVQAMVHGDRGDRSAAGVLFTRDPSTGEPVLYGEFLPGSRGEDVVSGTKVPRPLAELAHALPEAYAELADCARRLEGHFGDMQDIEFTIELGTLWLLQTRTGKRSGRAMVRIAADLCREGVLEPRAALLRIEPRRLHEVLRPTVDPSSERMLLTRGLPASPGVATAKIVFSTAEVEAHARAGVPTLLVRSDTSSDDIVGIKLAAGLLTTRGGMTSHAAVVARGLGRVAVVGASALRIDLARQTLSSREHTLRRGDVLTLDGNTGEVLLGEVPLSATHVARDSYLQEVLSWAATRPLRVYALAGTAAELQLSHELRTEGVIRRQPLTLTLLTEPAAERPGIEVTDAQGVALVADGAACEFAMLSADLSLELDDAVQRIRAARPKLPLGLCVTRLYSDEVEVVARAISLGLDFVACPPLRVAIAVVAAAQAAFR